MAASDPGGTACSATCRTRSCCKCNGSGACKNCSCVKAGNACSNCLPSRRNGCHNPRNVQLFPGSAPSTVVASVDSSTSTSVNPPALSSGLVSLACDDAAVFQSTPTPLPDGTSPGGNTLPAFVPMAESTRGEKVACSISLIRCSYVRFLIFSCFHCRLVCLFDGACGLNTLTLK